MNLYAGLQASKDKIDVGEIFTVDYIPQNMGNIDFKGKNGALLVSADSDEADILAVLGFNENVEVLCTEMKRFNTVFNCEVPSDIPSGNYWIRAVLQPEGSNTWIYPDAGTGKVNGLPLFVENSLNSISTLRKIIDDIKPNSNSVSFKKESDSELFIIKIITEKETKVFKLV